MFCSTEKYFMWELWEARWSSELWLEWCNPYVPIWVCRCKRQPAWHQKQKTKHIIQNHIIVCKTWKQTLRTVCALDTNGQITRSAREITRLSYWTFAEPRQESTRRCYWDLGACLSEFVLHKLKLVIIEVPFGECIIVMMVSKYPAIWRGKPEIFSAISSPLTYSQNANA